MIKKIASAPIGAKKMGDLGERHLRKMLPWRIGLNIQPSLLELGLVPVIYYIRGPDPQAACMLASKMWLKWEKVDKGLGDQEFPDVVDFGYAECIDEGDFRKAWSEIQKHNLPHAVYGNLKNPSAFTCFGRTDV